MTKSESDLIEAALEMQFDLKPIREGTNEWAKKRLADFLGARRRVAREMLEATHPAWRDEIVELNREASIKTKKFEELRALAMMALDDEERDALIERLQRA